MNVRFENDGKELYIYFEGELDHHNILALRDKVDTMIQRTRPTTTVLDFEKVPFTDSSGIALVMGRYKLINSLGGKLSIKNLCPQVKKILNIGGIERLVSII